MKVTDSSTCNLSTLRQIQICNVLEYAPLAFSKAGANALVYSGSVTNLESLVTWWSPCKPWRRVSCRRSSFGCCASSCCRAPPSWRSWCCSILASRVRWSSHLWTRTGRRWTRSHRFYSSPPVGRSTWSVLTGKLIEWCAAKVRKSLPPGANVTKLFHSVDRVTKIS